MPNTSDHEAALLGSIAEDPHTDVRRALREIPEEFRIADLQPWRSLIVHATEHWRRVAAMRVVCLHGLTPPISVTDFERDLLVPLGVDWSVATDAGRISHVPLDRDAGSATRVIYLATGVEGGGTDALYLRLSSDGDRIDELAFGPTVLGRDAEAR